MLKSLPRSLLCLLAALWLASADIATVLPIHLDTTFQDYRWPKDIVVTDATNIFPPPTDTGVQDLQSIKYANINGYGLIQFKVNTGTSNAPQYVAGFGGPYESVVLYLATAQPLNQIAITFYDSSQTIEPRYSQSANVLLDQFSFANTRAVQWTRVIIPLNHTAFQNKADASYDVMWLQNMGGPMGVTIAGYFGPTPNIVDTRPPVLPPPKVESYVMAEGDDWATVWNTVSFALSWNRCDGLIQVATGRNSSAQ